MTGQTNTGIISPEQLRIGNFVLIKRNAERENIMGNVTGIQQQGAVIAIPAQTQAMGSTGELIAFHDLAPILLSPEIFEAAGFAFSNVQLWYQNKQDFVISHYKDGSFYCPFIQRIESPVIRYLHELQNLYFTLTGRELEVRL